MCAVCAGSRGMGGGGRVGIMRNVRLLSAATLQRRVVQQTDVVRVDEGDVVHVADAVGLDANKRSAERVRVDADGWGSGAYWAEASVGQTYRGGGGIE